MKPYYKAANLDTNCKRWGYDGKCAKKKPKRKGKNPGLKSEL